MKVVVPIRKGKPVCYSDEYEYTQCSLYRDCDDPSCGFDNADIERFFEKSFTRRKNCPFKKTNEDIILVVSFKDHTNDPGIEPFDDFQKTKMKMNIEIPILYGRPACQVLGNDWIDCPFFTAHDAQCGLDGFYGGSGGFDEYGSGVFRLDCPLRGKKTGFRIPAVFENIEEETP